MDFIDYDTFQPDSPTTATLPEPAPPLLLPINPNITSKLKGLSLLRKSEDKTPEPQPRETETKKAPLSAAEKYAKMSLKLLEEGSELDSGNATLLTDLPTTKGSLNDHFTRYGGSKPDVLLSGKLANVLNNYGMSESSLRDALNILQQKQELDLKGLIRSDILGSINRRKFRSEIEGELLKEHTVVLREFQPVIQKVENLGAKIDTLNTLNKSLNSDAGQIDQKVINEIEQLSNEKNLIILKKSLLNSFKKNFTLTQYEEHYLSNEDISLEYFQILHKCKTIHNNCSILLSLQNPALGMKIMEKMTKFLDLSYQRISFYLTMQLERAMSEYQDSTNIPLMKLAIFYLANDMKYFNDITNKLIESRSKSIVDDFLYQSSNTGSVDGARPIIFSAHDPLRYIGDILAFVHSVIVNESELITGLFEMGDGAPDEQSEFEKKLIQLENVEDVNRSVKTTIERIVGALSRPLKGRVEQVVRSEKNVKVVQKVFMLLDLYKMMLAKQLGADSECSIFETLDTLKALCVERVFGALKEKLAAMEKEFDSVDWMIDQYDDSLLAPDWLREWLDDTLAVFDEADDAGKVLGLDEEMFKNLCALVIEKPCEMVSTQAKKNFKENKANGYIFQLNCLDSIVSKIVTSPQLTTVAESLRTQITTLEEQLTQEQYTQLLKNSGLSIHQQLIQLVFPIEQIESDEDLCMYESLIENKLFGVEKLQEVETKLHEFLPTALMDIQQSLFKISSPTIAENVITGSSKKFMELYSVFFKVVNMLYEESEHSLLEFTTMDVATLLGVEKAL